MAMLSKCSNPRCSAQFSYLHQGKLFRRDTLKATGGNVPTFRDDREMDMPARHIEFFWLCDDCATAMTLTFDRSAGVTVHPLKRALAAAASSSS
jgi:hypothetical protein